MGRKPVPAKLKRSEKVQFTLTPSERAALEKRAYADGYATVSEFIRAVIVDRLAQK